MPTPGQIEQQFRDAADLVRLGALDGLPSEISGPLAELLTLASADFAAVERMNTAAAERAQRLGGIDGQTYVMHGRWVVEALKIATAVLAAETP